MQSDCATVALHPRSHGRTILFDFERRLYASPLKWRPPIRDPYAKSPEESPTVYIFTRHEATLHFVRCVTIGEPRPSCWSQPRIVHYGRASPCKHSALAAAVGDFREKVSGPEEMVESQMMIRIALAQSSMA